MNSDTPAPLTTHHEQSATAANGWMFLIVVFGLFALALALLISGLTHQAPIPVIFGVLSIIAAVREAYAHRKADKELIRQYRFMQRIFTAARAALDRTHDPGGQREILVSLGEAALSEHAEWTLMHRERHVEHSKL